MITISITSYNRSDLTIESISKVYDYPLVDEIVIVDDCSEKAHWLNLRVLISIHPAKNKIKLFRNEKNLGMSLNKAEAVSKAKNEWVIILDSDNVLYPEYLDAIEREADNHLTNPGLQDNIIYQPSECESEYTFKQFEGMFISKKNAKEFLHIREFRIMLNQCNYLVNREKYLEVYKYDETIKESDTIYFNQLWLAAGNSFYVTPGMKYFHRRHPGSGWLMGNYKYNMKKADEIQELIKQL